MLGAGWGIGLPQTGALETRVRFLWKRLLMCPTPPPLDRYLDGFFCKRFCHRDEHRVIPHRVTDLNV